MVRPWLFFGAMLALCLAFTMITVVNIVRYFSYPAGPLRWSPREPPPMPGSWIELSRVEVHCNRLFVERRPGPRNTVLERFASSFRSRTSAEAGLRSSNFLRTPIARL
jgi:hypothetical protein